MKPNLLLRIATLAFFFLLLGSFVAYRAGAFDLVQNKAPVRALTAAADHSRTIPVRQKTVSVEAFFIDETMTSSKSGAIVIPEKEKDKEPVPVKTPAPVEPVFMPGSKSSRIVRERLSELGISDSTRKSLQRLNTADSVWQRRQRMMFSSKSGFIYEPEDFEKPDTLRP